MKEKRDIIEIVNLIRYLEDWHHERSEKAAQIKAVRDNGDITAEEALEIALEYFG